jgi:hypothetical protein
MWEHKWEEEKYKKKLTKMAEGFVPNKTQVRVIKPQLPVRKGLRPFVLILCLPLQTSPPFGGP